MTDTPAEGTPTITPQDRQEHCDAFRAALIPRVEQVPGLIVGLPQSLKHGLSSFATWLHWEGDEDDRGYWVDSELGHSGEHPVAGLVAYLAVAYYWYDAGNDSEESDRVLSLKFDHYQARDVQLHAALVVAAVRLHGARRGLAG
ncbi:hypothetical protein SAMN05421833_129128 [Microbispora rosea]|uniref:Uncharacterized protein n=1 Tax=Microbispora rosea TaxID=58117 RepID=A0A1N7GK10_9ACTN|nr:hypothetical protein [Microbispora rosea]SIS12880.1 hypothetical protein SAMN05421833_129128 [Microbispora rosea]